MSRKRSCAPTAASAAASGAHPRLASASEPTIVPVSDLQATVDQCNAESRQTEAEARAAKPKRPRKGQAATAATAAPCGRVRGKRSNVPSASAPSAPARASGAVPVIAPASIADLLAMTTDPTIVPVTNLQATIDECNARIREEEMEQASAAAAQTVAAEGKRNRANKQKPLK